jgi:hypothetical protein
VDPRVASRSNSRAASSSGLRTGPEYLRDRVRQYPSLPHARRVPCTTRLTAGCLRGSQFAIIAKGDVTNGLQRMEKVAGYRKQYSLGTHSAADVCAWLDGVGVAGSMCSSGNSAMGRPVMAGDAAQFVYDKLDLDAAPVDGASEPLDWQRLVQMFWSGMDACTVRAVCGAAVASIMQHMHCRLHGSMAEPGVPCMFSGGDLIAAEPLGALHLLHGTGNLGRCARRLRNGVPGSWHGDEELQP